MSQLKRDSHTPPNTNTMTSHPLAIKANGEFIGAVNQWSPEMSMDVNPVYEFGSFTGPYGGLFGQPYEMVPGNMTNLTIRVQRYDLYPLQMERAFGTTSLDMLSRDPGVPGQSGQFSLRERWSAPNAADGFIIVYDGCWFTNIGRTISSTDNRIINVNASIVFTSRRREPIG